jgi:hypothetical protein
MLDPHKRVVSGSFRVLRCISAFQGPIVLDVSWRRLESSRTRRRLHALAEHVLETPILAFLQAEVGGLIAGPV